MKNKNKKKIGILILIILIIPISLAITGDRSLTPEMQDHGYMCDNGKYQISISPVTGYTMEERLSVGSGWRFSSLEGDAVFPECSIQDPPNDNIVRCGSVGSKTKTLIFNVLNAPGTFSNVFSNDQGGDTASGLNPVTVKENICSPDNDNDKYPGTPITNICGCDSAETDCDDTNDSIYPGAEEIAGDGIDQDCDGADVLLASTIYRVLPDTVSEDVEFEITLNVDYTGNEDSFVIDERFDTAYFKCGDIPDNNGVCSDGKVRWVITSPIFQLKYYLIPKSEEDCYDFSDINGVSGKYLFKTRSEQEILGDYIIGTMECVDCIPVIPPDPPVEVCGNEIDEDCDGNICAGQCTIENIEAENCDDGEDNDCDNKKDWDTLDYRGPEKGDDGCAVGVTLIDVSDANPYENSVIDVSCTTTVPGINSVKAFIGTTECNGDTPGSSWNGNIYTFKDCNVGLSGTKTAKCTIDTLKSYQSGEDQTKQIIVQACQCSGTICNPANNGLKCTGCIYEDVSDTENEAALNCNDGIDNDCDGECDYDALACPGITHGDYDCPVDII